METSQPSIETSTEANVHDMSQVILRDEEIKGLKIENQRMAEIVKKKEEEKRFIENKSKELLDKNEKLAEKIPGQLPVHGASHLIWDIIIKEATKIRPYLDFMKDKEMVINVAR